MKDEIKIITLGDIFKNLETEEKAFKFKDYITNLQTIEQQYSAILSENAELENKITDLQDTLKDREEYCYGLETQLTNLQEDYDEAMKLVDKGVENSYKKLKEQQKEITRLNKKYEDAVADYEEQKYIINELEKWLEEYIPLLEAGDLWDKATQDTLKKVLDKLQELKEGK